jgi:hypothetical protein
MASDGGRNLEKSGEGRAALRGLRVRVAWRREM